MHDVRLAVPAVVPRASRPPRASDEFWARLRQLLEGAGRR